MASDPVVVPETPTPSSRVVVGGGKISTVGGQACWGCGTTQGYGLLISPPKGGVPTTVCAKCSRELLGGLLRMFIRVSEGNMPHVMDPSPIEKG